MPIIEPTSAVLPPAAAVPVSGCMTPTLNGLAWPNASRQGAGTSMLAPSAPAAVAERPRNLRRVVLPLHHRSFAHASSCHRSAIVTSWGPCLRDRHIARKTVILVTLTALTAQAWREDQAPAAR